MTYSQIQRHCDYCLAPTRATVQGLYEPESFLQVCASHLCAAVDEINAGRGVIVRVVSTRD
jgi:hypothetical protein